MATLRKMTDSLAHRGPDGEGFHLEGPVAIGHRRLAIIDLSPAGKQPMVTENGRFVISYNGEIYNFQQIRSELEKLGQRFNSRTDSEVALRAFAHWGQAAVLRFNGMFAFAIWDKKKKELFLARDRYGIKPVYYTVTNGVFIFGSEIKAILQHPAYRASMDKQALAEYFIFQNFFTERTLFKDVSILAAGCHMLVGLGGGKPEFTRYWDYHFAEPDNTLDENQSVEELDRLFRQAVQRQLVSDVDVGSYLSGGMDSGSITALAAQSIPYIRTFTAGFDLTSASGMEMGFDERERAERMSYLFKTEHYEMVLKAGDMERIMPRLAWAIEEPRVGQSYPNYYMAQLAGKFVKVVLSGTGGDELFGGYPWRYYRAVVNDDFDHYVQKYYKFWQRLLPDSDINAFLGPMAKDIGDFNPQEIFRMVFKEPAAAIRTPEEYVNHSLYFEAKTFLHGLLVVEDKISMAHGVESRVPFLDNDLVDFAMRLPVSMKLGNLENVVRINENEPGPKTSKYYQKTKDGKLLLRKAMARYIPNEVTEGVKQGFSAPDASWFKGESIEFVRREIFNGGAGIYEYVDRDVTRKLVMEHLEGKENHRLLIWSLLSVEIALKKFF